MISRSRTPTATGSLPSCAFNWTWPKSTNFRCCCTVAVPSRNWRRCFPITNPGFPVCCTPFHAGRNWPNVFTDLGLHLAFGGAVTRPRAKQARQAARSVALERILLETDAPSIGLEGAEPQDVEPGHVADIALALAALRQEPLAFIEETTTRHARALFHLP